MTQPHDAPSIRAVLPAILIAIGLCTFGWRSMDEAPAGSSGTGFSAEAGMATLSNLLQEQLPHPLGSPQNDVVRDRILATFREAGYQPQVEATFQCAAPFGCATVQNIVAIRPGTDSTRAVMVSAHYDSVPAGPGASDDGAGTAIVLELARAVAKRPATKNDIVFLLSDGEELGLFGAHSFVARDPAMKRIPVMVNLEARGAGGPSVMFETGDGNAHLMKLYGKAVARPVANSLAFEIYKRLPNGTDFTVYRDHGVIGFNLAFLAKASLYHTPLDNLANLERSTFQHHGDNAFALVSALADENLASINATEDASYFDAFGRYLVQWPAKWNLPAAGVTFLIVLLLLVMRRRELNGAGRALGWSLWSVIAPLVLLAGLGYGLAYPLGHWPGALLLDHPMPWPGRAALLFSAVLVALIVGAVAGRRNAAVTTGWAVWLVMSAAAIALSFLVPGASYPLLIPCAGFAIVALAFLLTSVPCALFWASAVGLVLATFFWTGLLVMFESALGFRQSMIKLLALAPLTWAAVPVIAHALTRSATRPVARASLPLLLAAAGIIFSAAAAALVPAVTADRPRGINVMYQDDGAATPRWIAYTTSPESTDFLDAAGFPREQQSYYLLGAIPTAGRTKAATALPVPPPPPTFLPEAEATATATATPAGTAGTPAGARVLRGTLRLPAEATAGGLTIGPNSGLLGLRIEGQTLWTAEDLKSGAGRSARLAGVSGKDLALELTLAPGAKGPIVLYQRMPLPDSAEATALRSHRPAEATPFGYGDSAFVLRRIALP